jgi:hypothetical protein
MPSRPTTHRNTALTFGLEIEFCIASLNPSFTDPHPTSSPSFRALDRPIAHPRIPPSHPIFEPECFRSWCVQLRIARALTSAGFPAITEKEISISRTYTEAERLSKWVVTDDASINEPDEDRYSWYKIEINSPAFYYNQAAVRQVRDVCKLLTSTFRVHVNESMGVHVHVGDGKRGFETVVLRTLMAILFVFEQQFSTLHPKHRGDKNPYCKSLNSSSKLGRQAVFDKLTNPIPRTRADLLEELLAMEKKEDIVEAMYQTRYDYQTHKLAYNLSNMKGPSPKHTIEFRQHESTLDPESIANWIRLCVGLVEVPFRDSRESIESLLRVHVSETVQEFDVVKVLLELNLTAQAEFYDTRFHALWIKNEKSIPVEVCDDSDSEIIKIEEDD